MSLVGREASYCPNPLERDSHLTVAGRENTSWKTMLNCGIGFQSRPHLYTWRILRQYGVSRAVCIELGSRGLGREPHADTGVHIQHAVG